MFMKKATKWAMGIIAFAILILVVIWGSMKMVQLEEEQEQAQKKLEEEQKVKEQKEAEKLSEKSRNLLCKSKSCSNQHA